MIKQFFLEEKCRDSTENRTNLQSVGGRRGSLQLWQFLVALLDAPDASAGCIAWTGRGMEFKLIEPEEVSNVVLASSCLQNTYYT